MRISSRRGEIKPLGLRGQVGFIAILCFILFLHLFSLLNLQITKSEYEEVAGIIVRKYTESRRSYRTRKRTALRTYIDVKYNAEGEERVAERLSANFWESEQDVVHLYIMPDGGVTRGYFVFSVSSLLCIITLAAFLIYDIWRNGLEISLSWSPATGTMGSVGTVIPEPDLMFEGPDKEEQGGGSPLAVPDKGGGGEPPLAMPEQKQTGNIPNGSGGFELYTEEEWARKKKGKL